MCQHNAFGFHFYYNIVKVYANVVIVICCCYLLLLLLLLLLLWRNIQKN